MQEEIWKDIPGYEGIYQVSSHGRVHSLDRVTQYGTGGATRFQKGVIVNPRLRNGYKYCNLSTNGIVRTYQVHQLMAMTFLNHTPNGYKLVVDHINNIPTDNRLENLQLVSNRHNSSKDRKGTSQYTGVHWHIRAKKWAASIKINGRATFLGYFTNEDEAGLSYQNALAKLQENETVHRLGSR